MILNAGSAAGIDLLQLHRLRPDRYPFLLESAAAHAVTGRFDILFAFPGPSLMLPHGSSPSDGARFLADLSSAQAESGKGVQTVPAVPFAGGWFVYLGYEAAAAIEPRLKLPPSPYALPDALAVRCSAAVVVDRARGSVTLVAESDSGQIEAMRADLEAAATAAPGGPESLPAAVVEEDAPQDFIRGVQRVLDYLAAGDTFQVNLSRAWRLRFASAPDPALLYARLRRHNPAPFAGLMRWGGAAVISSSPERLAAVAGASIETRPIAGTCARLDDAKADRALRDRFLASYKERAEHIMLIDLERNDLGRVCEPGSVEVHELMQLETYAHVHHLVSGVRGRLRTGATIGDILRAVFPGGTITGCPKVRAMEIIAELEQSGRGPYTGTMGYISSDGRIDLNILIRTMVLEGTTVSLRAGAGIVADSDPGAELEETRHKARGLLRALEQA
jgi:anthranilate synthase component 1